MAVYVLYWIFSIVYETKEKLDDTVIREWSAKQSDFDDGS